jgi:NADPH:quinone reductase
MKALICRAFGEPETLEIEAVPLPQPGPGELRIRVAAAGLNYPDGLLVQGKYQVKPPLPFAPGSELAGLVDMLGSGVTGFSVGDRICAMTPYDTGKGDNGLALSAAPYGSFADYVIVKTEYATLIPAQIDFETASAILTTYVTSHHALRQRANLQTGETLLVLGAAGGIGLAAVELGKAMGAHVIAAASSPEKLALAVAHGADDTINYVTEDLKLATKALTKGRGVDVICDPVGGAYAEPAFRAIAPHGRYLVVGFTGGYIPAMPLNLPLLKNASIVGVAGGFLPTREPEVFRANLAEMFDWMVAGKLKPHISRRFKLAEGPAALRWLLDRKATGKAIIAMAD